jgi:hypothetical protein
MYTDPLLKLTQSRFSQLLVRIGSHYLSVFSITACLLSLITDSPAPPVLVYFL